MKLESAVKKTIRYAADFKSHINRKEIIQRLISKDNFSEKEVIDFVKKIGWKNKKNKWYQIKMEKAENLAKEISDTFEDILFFGVSGSVASGHPKKDDDIDILIITKSNKIWKNRLMLRWWIFKKSIPHRKYSQEGKRDEFCFNLWLDEAGLEIKKDRQKLKNGIDLILMKPIINKNQIYEKFLATNFWVKKYSAIGYKKLVEKYRLDKIIEQKSSGDWQGVVTNHLFFWPQYWYMKRKMKGEEVGFHQAFFHRPMVK